MNLTLIPSKRNRLKIIYPKSYKVLYIPSTNVGHLERGQHNIEFQHYVNQETK